MDIGQLIKVDEAAKALGLSKFFLYRLAAENKIPHFRAGRTILFDLEEVHAWMKNNAKESEINGE